MELNRVKMNEDMLIQQQRMHINLNVCHMLEVDKTIDDNSKRDLQYER
jgi:hypothetical protein